MEKISVVTGVVAPLDRANIDTDAIIPKQYLKSIQRTGFGRYLFDEWRYLDQGEPGMDCHNRPKNPDFLLNQSPYKNAKILLCRENFGCGSSREHAPWAIKDFGFQALLAPSFADIFYNNCFKNGLLPIELSEEIISDLFVLAKEQVGCELTICLKDQSIKLPDGKLITFNIADYRKKALIEGLDEIGLTLSMSQQIQDYEKVRAESEPWVFNQITDK